jgi:DNA transposition AAA+ family ATPase
MGWRNTYKKERDCMSDIYDEELHRKFFDVVGSSEEGKRFSQSKAALAVGCSSAVISAYKNRTYSGNVKAIEEKIDAWLKRVARRSDRLEIPVAETSALKKMRKAIAMAQDEADIAVITGEAGSGKTTAMRQYEKESHSALFIEVDPSFSKVTLINEIAHALGVEDKGGMNNVMKRVIEALKNRDAVLIIDEADYLSDSSLELVRRINDKAHTGVVLAGLPRLEYKIRNIRNDHQQLASRVGVIVKLDKLKKADAEKIISTIWKDIQQPVANAFIEVAGGSVRTLTKLMSRVHQFLVINHVSAPNAEIIAEAGELLMR